MNYSQLKSQVKSTGIGKLLLRIRNKLNDTGLHPDIKPEKKMSLEEFTGIFNKLGVLRGDCVVVHHSSGNLGLEFNPVTLIELLQEAVGPEGNIIMLAEPFRGRSLNYLKDSPTFNLDEPCKLGIISEIFRRSEDVYRTVNPVSSVCIWGKNAKELSRQHKSLEFAFGEDSVYGYCNKVNAKVLGLGVDVVTLSPIHYFETLLKDRFPIYTGDKYKVELIDENEKKLIEIHALTPHTLRNWKQIAKAVENEPGSQRFIAHDRVFYSTSFSSIGKIINELIGKNKFFKNI